MPFVSYVGNLDRVNKFRTAGPRMHTLHAALYGHFMAADIFLCSHRNPGERVLTLISGERAFPTSHRAMLWLVGSFIRQGWEETQGKGRNFRGWGQPNGQPSGLFVSVRRRGSSREKNKIGSQQDKERFCF